MTPKPHYQVQLLGAQDTLKWKRLLGHDRLEAEVPDTPIGLDCEHGVPGKTDVDEDYEIKTADYTQHAAAFPTCSPGKGLVLRAPEIFMSLMQCPSNRSEVPAQLRVNHAQLTSHLRYLLSCSGALRFPPGRPDVTAALQPTMRQKLPLPIGEETRPFGGQTIYI
ncbi:hypothetical protein CB1_002210006 [Camelus ferus]|nr:hypothetical protein CB1_002210006 [Camelus ferus]